MRGATRSPYRSLTCPQFQSTLLMRGATSIPSACCILEIISIHAPHARSDSARRMASLTPSNFNPRSSCEERRRNDYGSIPSSYFNPRSSCEERRTSSTRCKSASRFQSTLLMRGATCRAVIGYVRLREISIHAPHARSDLHSVSVRSPYLSISIHAPHARSDRGGSSSSPSMIFQSTLLMRGATAPRGVFPVTAHYFNPRSSCEERPCDSAAA